MNRNRFLPACAAFLVLTLAASSLPAQEFRGSILGTVTDPTGAVIPGARVIVTNESTNTSTEAVTNSVGNYVVPFLLPARYTVSVEVAGFKSTTRKGIVVQVQDKVTLNFSLEIGAPTQIVTITSESPMLSTGSSDLGQVIERHYLDRMPITGRSPMFLADLAPGVMAGNTDYTSNDQNRISINGGNGADRGNDISVDGMPNVAPRQSGLVATMPMGDAVEEFKVNTTLFDASQGRSAGGTIAVTTRGGTNQFHGAGYHYRRDPALNALSWTEKNSYNGMGAADRQKFDDSRDSQTYWILGGTFGGPIRKDRTFFFAAYERIYDGRSITKQGWVPTALERKGDFSQSKDNKGNALLIYDPLSTVLGQDGKVASRTLFPVGTAGGSVVPSSRIDPTATAVLNLYPQPTQTGAGLDRMGSINWIQSFTLPINTQNLQARVDHQLSNRQRVYLRVSRVSRDQEPEAALFDGFPGLFSIAGSQSDIEADHRKNWSVSLNDTITLSPTFLGTLGLGFTRTALHGQGNGIDRNPADLKVAPIIISNQAATGWPNFRFSGIAMPEVGGRFRDQINNVYSLMATFNKLSGAHNFRFGLDWRTIRWNENNPDIQSEGLFTFSNRLTAKNPDVSDGSGAPIASFLLGLPTSGLMAKRTSLALQTHYSGLFFQDDWKISKRLTINLGLRWELETPFTDRYDKLPYGFDETADVGVTAPGLAPLKGGMTFVNVNGLPRSMGKTDWNNFGPRFGFAYSLNDKTVLRGGYGIFFESYSVSGVGGNPGTVASFNATTTYVSSTDSDRTVLPGINLANPFPDGLIQPTGSSLGLRTELGNAIAIPYQDRVLPYTQQWQLSLQRELPWQMLVQIAYVGTHALKLYENLNWNEQPDALRRDTSTMPNPFLGIFPATSVMGKPATIQTKQLKLIYPQFAGVTYNSMNTSRAQYHGLQSQVQKRLSGGLAFVVAYAFSKQMAYTMTSLINSRSYNRTSSLINTPHIFRTNLTYDIPVGRGFKFGENWRVPADWLVGGWSLTWSTRYTSGATLGPSDARAGRERPIPIGDPNMPGDIHDKLGDRKDASGKVLNPYFNLNAFQRLPDSFAVTPTPVRLSWMRGPSEFYHSASMFKLIRIRERFQVELRVEADNIFNTPQFGSPSTDVTDPNFGVITTGSNPRVIRFGGKLRF
jgi:hypothetical protein